MTQIKQVRAASAVFEALWCARTPRSDGGNFFGQFVVDARFFILRQAKARRTSVLCRKKARWHGKIQCWSLEKCRRHFRHQYVDQVFLFVLVVPPVNTGFRKRPVDSVAERVNPKSLSLVERRRCETRFAISKKCVDLLTENRTVETHLCRIFHLHSGLKTSRQVSCVS